VARYNELSSNVRRRKRTQTTNDQVGSTKKLKQQSVASAFENANLITQRKVDELIVDFIVSGMLSLHTVELPAFRNLITGLQPNKKVMSRDTLRNLLQDTASQMKVRLEAILADQKFVATTTDCWTSFGKAYLGITVHWIDRQTRERRSACLALRRMKGSHNFDVIAKMLEDIHKEFGIETKIVKTTTDNGSNFVKAFSCFGETTKLDDDNESYEGESETLDQEVEGQGVTEIFVQNIETKEYSLPKHQRCASHTLHLIATKDADKAESVDAQYKKVSRSALAKCQGLWNKFGRSALVVDAVTEAFQLGLKRPNQTRWNSVYFAIQRLIKLIQTHGEDLLNNLCTRLGLPKFARNEITFLNEYVSVMAPLARALDILQGEKKMYLGYLIPTLLNLRDKLSEKLSSTALTTCKPLAQALINGLDNRFAGMINEPENIAAAIMHPFFKKTWTEDAVLLDKGMRYIKQRLGLPISQPQGQGQNDVLAATSTNTNEDEDADSDFFRRTGAVGRASMLEQFLSTDCCSMSEPYPAALLDLFMELNTPLPASASVERLFSIAGLTQTKKRTRLSDSLFESLVFVKVNKPLF
jgi:hypothetical protein